MQVRFLAVRLIRYGVVGAFIGGGGLFAIEIDSQQARKNGNGHQDVNIKFRSFFGLCGGQARAGECIPAFRASVRCLASKVANESSPDRSWLPTLRPVFTHRFLRRASPDRDRHGQMIVPRGGGSRSPLEC